MMCRKYQSTKLSVIGQVTNMVRFAESQKRYGLLFVNEENPFRNVFNGNAFPAYYYDFRFYNLQ